MSAQSSPPDAGDDLLAQRYGAPAPWRRRLVQVASVVVALVFAGWLVWTIYEHSTPQVTSELETFSIDDDHSATAVVVVHLHDADVRATCRLIAYSEDHAVVGADSFTPDPATARQTRTIRTERRATSVEDFGCTTPDQDQPR